jgi:hypothetical protein
VLHSDNLINITGVKTHPNTTGTIVYQANIMIAGTPYYLCRYPPIEETVQVWHQAEQRIIPKKCIKNKPPPNQAEGYFCYLISRFSPG